MSMLAAMTSNFQIHCSLGPNVLLDASVRLDQEFNTWAQSCYQRHSRGYHSQPLTQFLLNSINRKGRMHTSIVTFLCLPAVNTVHGPFALQVAFPNYFKQYPTAKSILREHISVPKAKDIFHCHGGCSCKTAGTGK